MRSHHISMTKTVLSLKIFLILLSIFVVSACGKKHNKNAQTPPAAPCTTGINRSSCQTGIAEVTSWSSTTKTYALNPQTKETIPDSENIITVFYEFFPAVSAGNLPQWKRSVLLTTHQGRFAMSQTGEIKSIDATSIQFIINKDSCYPTEEKSDEFLLYYDRNANQLEIDTQPIAKIVVKNPLDLMGKAIGNIIGKAVGEFMRTSIEMVFSFSSAKTLLTNGHGLFTLEPEPFDLQLMTKSAELGCMSSFGLGFTPMKELVEKN